MAHNNNRKLKMKNIANSTDNWRWRPEWNVDLNNWWSLEFQPIIISVKKMEIFSSIKLSTTVAQRQFPPGRIVDMPNDWICSRIHCGWLSDCETNSIGCSNNLSDSNSKLRFYNFNILVSRLDTRPYFALNCSLMTFAQIIKQPVVEKNRSLSRKDRIKSV